MAQDCMAQYYNLHYNIETEYGIKTENKLIWGFLENQIGECRFNVEDKRMCFTFCLKLKKKKKPYLDNLYNFSFPDWQNPVMQC